MKKILLLFAAFAAYITLKAQPKAVEGTTDFQRTAQPAAIIELPYPTDVVEKAIDDYMVKNGAKGSNTKGFTVYRGYRLQDATSDLYFSVDRKSRREKDISVIYLVVGKNGEDVKARQVNDDARGILPAARGLLDSLAPSVEAYNLEMQIQDQDDAVKKSQKKYDGLASDQKDLEKKIKNLQDRLEQNKLDQVKQDSEIKKQTGILELLKGKRKS